MKRTYKLKKCEQKEILTSDRFEEIVKDIVSDITKKLETESAQIRKVKAGTKISFWCLFLAVSLIAIIIFRPWGIAVASEVVMVIVPSIMSPVVTFVASKRI